MVQGEGVSGISSMEAEVLTLYSNGLDANLWESGEYFISTIPSYPLYISLWTHPSDPTTDSFTQLSPWKAPPFGARGLNIGRDGKRGSGGMATALFPFLCLATLFFPFFPIRESGARLDKTQPDWPRLQIDFAKAERHLIKQLLIKPDVPCSSSWACFLWQALTALAMHACK